MNEESIHIEFWKGIKANFVFLLLAFALVSSAIVYIPYGEYSYYAGILYLFFFRLKNILLA